MNFLALCQRLVREAPITGNGPASVLGQTGTMKQVVDWINTACIEIQSLRAEWRFMAGEFYFATTIGKAIYTGIEAGLLNLETWNRADCDMSVYEAVSDEQYLTFLPWEEFRPVYAHGSSRAHTGTPTHYTIKPDNSLMFYPIPDKEVTISGQYFKSPAELVENTDTPPFPATFHMAIVWSALMMYCAYDSIPDLYAQASEKYRKVIKKLELEQLPRLRHGAPLA